MVPKLPTDYKVNSSFLAHERAATIAACMYESGPYCDLDDALVAAIGQEPFADNAIETKKQIREAWRKAFIRMWRALEGMDRVAIQINGELGEPFVQTLNASRVSDRHPMIEGSQG